MDFFFTSDGRFSTAAKTGPRWGSAERDIALFTIIRTDKPEWLAALDDLRARRKVLAERGLWISENVFANGTLGDAPETEWAVPAKWTLLSTGDTFDSEDDAWDAAEVGDTLFMNKSNDPACPGVAVIVDDPDLRTGAVMKNVTLEQTSRISDSMAAAITSKTMRNPPIKVGG